MRYTKFFILFFSISGLFSACKDDFFDQVVNVDIPEHTPSLAVTSNLSNKDSILVAYVSSSIGVLDQTSPEMITDAKVELYKNGTLFQTLPHLQEGFYGWELDEALGNQDDTYEIRVEKEGFESVRSVQQMPDPVTITNATFEEDGTISEDGERVDELVIEFTDQKEVANYYKVETFLEFSIDGDVYEDRYNFDSNDPSVNFTNDGLYFSDIIFDGSDYELRLYTYYDIYVDPSWDNPTLVVNLVNVSSDRYFRETSVRAYENAEDNPFAEPAVIFSNIENGYGIFSLEAVSPSFRIPF